jgi:transposase
MPIKVIARVTGVSRNTVRAAIASDRPPKYERPARGSVADAAEPRIRELLKAYPTMPATVSAERIGWQHSVRVLRGRVAELRPAYLPPDPASRTAYAAGEVAQCDFWFPPATVPVGCGQERSSPRLPVLTMVSGYSRWLSAVLVPSRHSADLFAGWWQLIEALGAVPRVLVWDGEGAIGRHRGGKSELTADCQAFRGTLGTRVIICKPADPEAKGLVERANGYLETSFLPGRAFASPADFNAQLGEWTALANSRFKRALGCAPAGRIDADRAAMAPLPPLRESSLGWHNRIRLPRDHYVRVDTCDYSVDPAVIGRMVDVRADLGQVTVTCEGRLVACHDRSWVAHQTVTDQEHKAAADVMRAERLRAKLAAPPAAVEVEQRDLSRYDVLLGGGEVA